MLNPQTARPRLRRRLADLRALSADVSRLTARFGAAVRAAGCSLVSYTTNTEAQVDRALAAGACGVMSDRPGWLSAYLRRGR